MPNPIILICSVALELDPLLPFIAGRRRMGRAGSPAWAGTIGDHPVVAVAGGMGKSNAAHSLTVILERTPGEAVIGFGVGGAYAGSGLGVAGTAVASVEVYGDEGVLAPSGWISCEGIGIPLVDGAAGRFFNAFPCDAALVGGANAALSAQGVRPVVGAFVTVSTCSGTVARGGELAERFGAICETMEGAAYAHVAALYEVPYLEIRGISNLVEDRDMSRWNLGGAADVAAAGVAATVAELVGTPPSRSESDERRR